MKVISPKMHGVLDYFTAGTFIALPRMMGWSERTTTLLTGAGVAVIGLNLLTRYEFGLIKVLPMNAHLALDGVLDAGIFAAQFQLTEEDSSVRGVLTALSLVGTAVTLLTRSE